MRLQIKNLHASVEGVEILKGIDLDIKEGEIHAIMGPNGSGKSTLAQVLAGHPAYEVTDGSVLFDGESLFELPPEERAREGLFLAFQYPVEIPGVSNSYFLKAGFNEIRKKRGEDELDAMDFFSLLKEKAEIVKMKHDFFNRPVNEGFSGGEKKRNEILQLLVMNPKLAVLDETDSGLDIDALKIVSHGVNKWMSKEKSLLLITHYQRLLDYIIPHVVHVVADGRIIKSGTSDLALELEEKGYDWLTTS